MRGWIGAELSTFTLELSKAYWLIYGGLGNMGLAVPLGVSNGSKSVGPQRDISTLRVLKTNKQQQKTLIFYPQKFSFNWSEELFIFLSLLVCFCFNFIEEY